MIYDLYNYQADAKKEISDLFQAGWMKIFLCSPTGSGKTVTFADICRDVVKNGYTVMIVVDRRELLDQANEKLLSYGLTPSLVSAGRSVRTGKKSYIATVQTLMKRKPPKVDLIIIDEAHKQIFDKVLRLEEYNETKVLGVSATPHRKGKMNQLSSFYSHMVTTVSINELIHRGFLVPAISYGAKMDTSGIKVSGRDFNLDSMYNAFNKQSLYAGVVDKYKKFANNTKAICFNINVEHSLKVVQAFRKEGISAVHLDGKTPKAKRKGILDSFSAGQFKVLCNCDVLTTGYDEWTIETVIVNRATKSLPLWLQMGGRGSRITPARFKGKPGYLQKEHFNLIDMGGNIASLGFWEQDREFSLSHKTKDTVDPAPVKECPEDKLDFPPRNDDGNDFVRPRKKGCGALLHASAPSCKTCGYIFETNKKEPVEAPFVQLENDEHLPIELVGRAWGSMNFEELEIVRKAKGYKPGWIVKHIIMREDLNLEDYAVYKGYKNPSAWVYKMKKMYVKK